jgi:hypothetical protein
MPYCRIWKELICHISSFSGDAARGIRHSDYAEHSSKERPEISHIRLLRRFTRHNPGLGIMPETMHVPPIRREVGGGRVAGKEGLDPALAQAPLATDEERRIVIGPLRR